MSAPPFENIPNWITDKVRSAVRALDPKEDRETAYLNAAGWVIAYYLGMNVASADCDDFFDYRPPSETGNVWHGQVNRVILVAETLFELRSTPAFPEMCRRMREAEKMRPFFLEMLEAKSFFKAGYQIYAKPETGVKGEDFDFIAVRDGETINAEVTALMAPNFSEKTVLNALRHKRTQVPNTAPAIIFCIIPEAWTSSENWNEKLPIVARKFLKQTKKINTVVFIAEKRATQGAGAGALLIIGQDVQNDNPRIPLRDTSFLRAGKATATSALAAVTSGAGLGTFVEQSYDAAFFHWVDYLRRGA